MNSSSSCLSDLAIVLVIVTGIVSIVYARRQGEKVDYDPTRDDEWMDE